MEANINSSWMNRPSHQTPRKNKGIDWPVSKSKHILTIQKSVQKRAEEVKETEKAANIMEDVSGCNSKCISDHDKLRWTGYQIRCKKHNLAWCCLQEIHPEKRCRRSSGLMKWDQTSWANMSRRKPASVTTRQLFKWHWREIMLTMGRTANYSSRTKSHFLFLCIMFYQNTATCICSPVCIFWLLLCCDIRVAQVQPRLYDSTAHTVY